MAKSLGRVIVDLRREANLSQAELSRASGISPGQLGRIERDERSHIRFVTACQLAKGLGITLDDLAIRVGLVKGTPKGNPSGEAGAVAAGLDKLESLLSRATYQAEKLRKHVR